MHLSRRTFIAGAAGAAGVTAAGAGAYALGLGTASGSKRAATTTPLAEGKGTLVLVALYGGNDGLNTVIPYQDPAYAAARPTIGVKPADVLALSDGLGLHPNLPGLKSLWGKGQLAIVRGVGYPDPDYSHFRSMDIWQSAVPETDEATGWLGRWLDTTDADPLLTLSIGPTMPQMLEGARTAGSAIPSGNLTLPAAYEKPFSALQTVTSGEALLASHVARSGTNLLTVLHSVKEILAAAPEAPQTSLETSAGNASNELATQLDLIARLIKGGLSTRVYVASLGGFDTHGDEVATQERLLAEVDAGITQFVTTMASEPAGQDVVVMTFSEFGRRVGENASGGTDHGSAAPLFVAGPRVKGGWYGDQPSLTDLDDGNLKFTTDFRSVYSTVLSKVLGVDPKSVLTDGTFPTLSFV